MFVSRFFWPLVRLLPLELTGDLTDYEFLTRICNKINELIESNNKLSDNVEINNEAIKALQEDVAAIEEELEKVKNGDYVSLYLDSIIAYINDNLQGLVGNIVKFVVFGLNNEGRFVAMTPSTWDFIHWSTIMDGDSELYGHLVLRW